MAPPAPDSPHAQVQQLDPETARRLFRISGDISIQWVAGLLGALIVAGFANVWSIGRYFQRLENTQALTTAEVQAVKATDIRHDATLSTTANQLALIQRDVAAMSRETEKQADILSAIAARIARIEGHQTR